MLGSDAADGVRRRRRSATVLARPGVLEDISSAYDSPATTVDAWVDDIASSLRWIDGRRSRAYAGDGPLITDDRPRPEYFLLRRLFGGAGMLSRDDPFFSLDRGGPLRDDDLRAPRPEDR